jgi:murein DD-endopeptidase MepM/ murein hydrolase activator NlpD
MRGIAIVLALLLPLGTAGGDDTTLIVPPGSVVRWPGVAADSCRLGDASWTPPDGTCWYPIDLLTPPGPLTVGRSTAGREDRATVVIASYPYPQQAISVEPKMVHPPDDQLERIRQESERVATVWRRTGPSTDSPPLSQPLIPMPAARSFGSRRILNGEPRSPHTGIDLTANVGTPVLAAARGEVALAAELYFAGRAVILDHGDRLFTMYYHLHRIGVRDGETVQRGQEIGTVGATGRVTGAHLHFAVRWRDARVDPSLLLGSSENVPTIAVQIR